MRDEGGPSSCFASAAAAEHGEGEGEGATCLLQLPTDCIVRVLSLLSVLDTCRVARVCSLLRAIADSDKIWLPRLPSNPAITPPSFSKKDLYFRLRAGMLRKDFSQPYWLDPATGEGCFVKSARDLSIEWGDDPRNWLWKPQPNSWFPDSAYLHDVCWFQVRGEFESIFMPGTYTMSFRICFTDALHGWAEAPVKLFLSTSNGQHVESQRFFSGTRTPLASKVAPLRSLDACLWMELDAGEFHVEREMHVKLKFRMQEIDGGQWKGGIILDCIKIQPSSVLSKDSYI